MEYTGWEKVGWVVGFCFWKWEFFSNFLGGNLEDPKKSGVER